MTSETWKSWDRLLRPISQNANFTKTWNLAIKTLSLITGLEMWSRAHFLPLELYYAITEKFWNFCKIYFLGGGEGLKLAKKLPQNLKNVFPAQKSVNWQKFENVPLLLQIGLYKVYIECKIKMPNAVVNSAVFRQLDSNTIYIFCLDRYSFPFRLWKLKGFAIS